MSRIPVSRIWPLTRGVRLLMIINGALWVLLIIAARFGNTAVFDHLALRPAMVYPGMHLWQPFTYMWLHSLDGFFHILLNLLFLWMFGGVLEVRWGMRDFLRFYLLCGFSAGCLVFGVGYLFYPLQPTVGASGAIYGLVAAWAISFPDHMVYLFGLFPIRGRHFALIPIGFALLDFLVGGSGISHAAHLGGLATGALLVTGLWRPSRLYHRFRVFRMRRKLKVLRPEDKEPPDRNRYRN